MRRRAVAVAFVVVVTVGCTEQKTVTVDNTVNGADPPPARLLGAALAQDQCARCHDPGDGSYSGRMSPVVGMAYPANLTPDPDKGIGSWSDDDIRTAIRTGVDDQAMPLCPVMPHFSDLTDEQVNSLVAFLRQLPAVAAAIPPSMCD
jgi:mono/diheme cytochrome c family protein